MGDLHTLRNAPLVGREDNNWDTLFPMMEVHIFFKLKAVHYGHHEVQNNEIRLIFPKAF